MTPHIPTISVIMACYNAAEDVEGAIKSILDQTYDDFEFILVDDGSIDNTYEILSQWKSQDERIILVKNPKNMGLAASLNRAIALCQAPWIARMDADDLALPLRLQSQMAYLRHHPTVDILGTAVFTKCNGHIDRSSPLVLPEHHEEIVQRVFRKTLVLHPTIMIRRSVYQKIATYDPQRRWAEDADLWYRIYDKVTWANLGTPLLIYSVKSRITLRIAYHNLMTKATNLSRRGMFWRYVHLLVIDAMHYSYRLIKPKRSIS